MIERSGASRRRSGASAASLARRRCKRRVVVAAVVLGALGARRSRRGSSTCRSFEHAELVARAERQQMRTHRRAGQARRHPRSPRPRARDERRRRHDLRGAHRRSPIARRRGREALQRARRLHGQGARRTLVDRLGAAQGVRLRPPAGVARPGAARRGAQSRRHRLHQGEPALLSEHASSPRTCSATSASTTTGLSGIEVRLRLADPRQGRARSWSRPTRGATRSAASSGRRPPARRIELTIDEYLQHIAERELHAGVVENRAAGGSAIVMNPHTGEILAMANEPTFNPNAYRDVDGDRAPQPRRAGSLRAGLDVQGRHRVGGDRREASCRSTR